MFLLNKYSFVTFLHVLLICPFSSTTEEPLDTIWRMPFLQQIHILETPEGLHTNKQKLHF